MDGLTAKRVFIALAKKFSCSSILRHKVGSYCKHKVSSHYILRLLSPSGNVHATIGVQIDDKFLWVKPMLFTSAKWAKMLQELEGKTIAICNERIKVNSVEQLIIDLELEGFLKTI